MAGDSGVPSLITQKNEHVKQYIELDGNSRVYKIFTVHSGAKVGSICSVTIYGYATPISTQMISRVETTSTWTQVHQDAIDLLLV